MSAATKSFRDNPTLLHYVQRLCSKTDAERIVAAQDLYNYISGELNENPNEYVNLFLDGLVEAVSWMLSSDNVCDKKGGIFTLEKRNVASTRLSRLGNNLRNFLPTSDTSVMELAAKAVGHVALAHGAYTAEYVNFELKRALEWLDMTDRKEERRLAAVLVLKELARATPTFFFQQVHQFFFSIFSAVKDPKPIIREQAVVALRAALVVTLQRETKQEQKEHWYKQCYDEAERCFDEFSTVHGAAKEDKAHSGLLISNELLRIANLEGEKLRQEVEELNDEQSVSKKYSPTNSRAPTSCRVFCSHREVENVVSWLVTPTKPINFESRTCRKQVSETYEKLVSFALKCRTCRQPFNQQILLQLFPRLAAFDTTTFVSKYLNDAVTYVVGCLTKDKDKSSSFMALGLIAMAVQENIQPHLAKVFDVIRQALPSKETPKRRQTPLDASVFTCVALLARALGREIQPQIKSILEPTFATGLSPGLTVALKEIVVQIPALKTDIQDGLLKQLSQIIMHRPMPSKLLPPQPVELPSGPVPVVDVPSTTLALSTLGKFQFPRHSLELFLKYIAAGYLNSDCREVRLEAVRTVARLLLPSVQILAKIKNKQPHLPLLRLIHEVIAKLLTVGITDFDCEIRLCVFQSLMEMEPFYIHLAQAEMLQLIFMGLQDEQYDIRESVIRMSGRLSDVNPALVMPTLRKVLIQVLGELSHSGITRNEEQSARLLAQLIASSPKFIKPYTPSTLKTLIPKLKSTTTHGDVIVSVMHAVGELANVGGPELTKQRGVLLPILIEFLQDSTSIEKREVALWTLGQLIESTGYVVDPYQTYPELLTILLRLLKTEQAPNIRRETIRVLGLIGALDPYKQKIFAGSFDLNARSTGLALSMPDIRDSKDPRQEIIQWFHWERCTLEEFYPAFAVVNLMHIVADSSLSQHHTAVVGAVMFIFKSLGVKCLPYLEQVVPSFVKVIRSSETSFREFLFQQLGVLISVVKAHIKPYLKDIFALIKEFWTPQTPMRNTIIMLVEQIAAALGPEFKPYIPELMPAMLRVFLLDLSESRAITVKLLEAFKVCGSTLEEHLHLIIPPIVKLFDTSSDTPIDVGKNAIETLSVFGETMNLSHYASRIIHALVRAIDVTLELRAASLSLLCILVIQMGPDYLVFRPMVDQVFARHKLTPNRYHALVNQVEKAGRINPEEDALFKKKSTERRAKMAEQMQLADSQMRKVRCNYEVLQRSWSVSRCVSKEDWIEWLRRFSVELLKEAPFPALRSCNTVAQTYYPLAKELFNAAFISCWTELPEQLQDDLIMSLQQAISFQEGPEITQVVLNLAEFMDHSEKGPLPVDPKLLGERALKTRAYAKALRYMEAEFHKSVNAPVLEALISINNKLQLHEASVGVVEYARKKEITVAIRERWYEKLHDWSKALDAYDRKQEQSPNDFELTLGRMRCMEALAEWGKLHALAKDKWETSNTEMKQKMARLAAAAAWGQGQWDAMEEYICLINRNSLEGAFFRAVQAVHQDQFHLAQQCVDKARDLIDTELTAMAAESYNRAYGTMVTVQTLSELEEAMQYKLIAERRPIISQMWWTRLRGCQDSVEDWQRLLQVRSLVLTPLEMRKTWTKFASLCRKNNKLSLSHKTLTILLGVDPSRSPEYALPMDKPDLTFAYCKHLWHEGKQDLALTQLKILVDTALKSAVLQRCEIQEQQELVKLKAKCFLKLGQWREANRSDNEPPLLQVIQYYRFATEWDRNWYKAWHALACSNFAAILYYKQQASRSTSGVDVAQGPSSGLPVDSAPSLLPPVSLFGSKLLPENMMNTHAVQAVQCFFRSIALCKTNSLQDTLRLLTLWFDYGQNPEVYDALIDGIKTVRIETWLQVIPQLIARIDTPRQLVSRLIMQLLMDIGKDHPQALVCPLTVAAKSANQNRAVVANRILKHMSDHSPNLVQQASLVSDELIRVAILWHELWHEGLEEASRQYFAERNVQGMFTTLEPLHNMIEIGPTTLKEQSFTQAYLRDLKEARTWCEKYKTSGNVKELTQAWDLYYHVFRRISKQLPQLTTLELHYVSPKLLMCQNLELAVPGTYDPNRPVIHIQSIHTSLTVITSKQRPRKVCIKGNDGHDYWFLLKGHEDPRQDERVMQLFGLVNTLLLQGPATCRRNLTIQRYSVIPLSQNSGLIGWVPNCDTLHALLRDYREKKKILLNIEHKLMQRMAPDYDHLTLMQKVEVFEHALEHTSGDDLQKILWLKSPSSEVWFDRRTNYTRSLATMSMVGYILGLGDRHPSNLMLDRMSGKIVHIDFGDCFEVAMTREKFPEKIPFRLTRMLVNAMEVTGIEGNFRTTCERVMAVLRENKESVMAVLEAFVYDPLINWRLIEQTVGAKKAMGDASDTVHEQDETGATMTDDRSRVSGIVPGDDLAQPTEVGNKKALQIIQRIRDKLHGRDFVATETYDVPNQVDLLIEQAISHENLCQCYIGWCPFW